MTADRKLSTPPGTLYLVGTPIGNLEDMAPRAVKVLREAAVIAVEDTRRTAKLLNHFGISTPMQSYHRHNEHERADVLIERLRGGESVALVTDAGLPGISDPGEILVAAAVKAGVQIIPVPGPSAGLLALACSGLSTSAFLFLGFLPRRGAARKTALAAAAAADVTIILYEAPHRLLRTLTDLREALGGGRRAVIARELTKVHEELWRGDLDSALAEYASREIKGEITLVLAGAERTKPAMKEITPALVAQVDALRTSGATLAQAVREVAETAGCPRNLLYQACLGDKNKPAAGFSGRRKKTGKKDNAT